MRGCLDEETLLDLIDGRRDLGADADLAAHLDGCADCRRLVADSARSRPAAPPGAHQDDATLLTAGSRVGRYVIVERVGQGAMGVVYAAEDPELGRRVAVKLLRARGAPEELRRRLAREAQAMAKLSHPHVIAVHDVGDFAGHVFVAMELVDGSTLGQWLRAERRPWTAVLAVLRQAGEGLAAAHAAGLVHRDFKPDNVLVGSDGRARVTDFGLARAAELDRDGALADAGGGHASSPADGDEGRSRPGRVGERATATRGDPVALTRSGALIGTPAYMAPEQLDAGHVDARSDQFAYCVTLFEALFGARPFAGGDVRALAANIRAGRIVEPPGARRVPRWLRRAVARGLAADPEARWRSLRALLDALAAGPLVTPARLGAAALVLVVAAVGALEARAHRLRCDGGAAAWGDVWSDSQRAGVERAFVASGRSAAPLAFAAVDRALSAYRRAFVRMHDDACRATRVYAVQSQATLDLRMACLEDRRSRAGALARLYSAADGDIVDRATAALEALAPIEGCADARALSAPLPLPADPARRAAIARLQTTASEASALAYAHRDARSLALVTPALAEAATLDHPQLEAQLLLVRARVEQNTGQHDAVAATLHRAAQTAERAHDDGAAADAFNMLVWNRGYGLPFRAEAEIWAGYAAAAIARLGGDDEREGTRLLNLGTVLWQEARLDEAQPLLQRARELMVKSRGADYWRIATVDTSLGGIALDRGHGDEALAIYRRATEERTRVVGPEHPLVAGALTNVALALTRLGRTDEALPEFARALAIMRQHPEMQDEEGWIRHRLALALRARGAPAQALAEDTLALTRLQAHRQADDPSLCLPLLGLGADRLALSDARAARTAAERALPLCARDEDPFELAEARLLLAAALARTGDGARARPLHDLGRAGLAALAGKYGAYYATALRAVDAATPAATVSAR